MAALRIIFGIFLAVIIYHCNNVAAKEKNVSTKTRLINSLVSNYEDIRGQLSIPTDDGMDVFYGIGLIRTKLDETNSNLIADTWLRMLWVDQRLAWDPSDFDGIKAVRIPAKYVWRPDITFYNTIERPDVDENLNVVVYHDGNVLYIPPARITVPCQEHPTGTYNCSVTVGSWTYDGNLLDINFYESHEEFDLSDYIMDHRVISNKAVKNTKYYECCEEPYPDLTFYLALQK